MNEYQINLYQNLLTLTNTNEAFYFKDQVLDNTTYRVFAYRLASYSDFCLPSALECRGIMFEMNIAEYMCMDDPDMALPIAIPVRLASMPMEKFFNDSENPMVMDLDYSNIVQLMAKMDGSLISTYTHGKGLLLKSKTSLTSLHAMNAMAYLDLPENKGLKDGLVSIESYNYTVNMEYTSPEPNMRIVIGYQEPRLTILNIRDKSNGAYLEKSAVIDNPNFRTILDHWVETPDLYHYSSAQQFIEDIPSMVGVEGFVIRLATGQYVKKKTDWYRALHFTKDSVNNPRRLYEAVLDETADDLREMFEDDPFALKTIDDMQFLVNHKYNSLVAAVENFYNENSALERKEYAIKGQQELDGREFALAMQKYLGKDISYKDCMKKWYKEFGIEDKTIHPTAITNQE